MKNDYKELYITLFNAISEEIERLKELQLKTEEIYMEEEK